MARAPQALRAATAIAALLLVSGVPGLAQSQPALPSAAPGLPEGLGGIGSGAPQPSGGLPPLNENPGLTQNQAPSGRAPIYPQQSAVQTGQVQTDPSQPVQFGASGNLPPGIPPRVALPGYAQEGQPPLRIDPGTAIGPVPVGQAATATGFDTAPQQGAQIDMSNYAVLPDGRIVPIDQIPSRDEMAFDTVLGNLLPLKPDQIRELRRQIDITDRAAADPVRPEQPSVSSLDISLAPGGAPPQIRTASGRVTALSFYDVTGAPYPVSAVVVGNPNLFQVEAPIPEGNLVTVTPLAEYAEGNMAITLLNQPVPILVKLIAGSEIVDYRLDMRVAARGPLAASPVQLVDGSPGIGGPVISAFLDGLPPEGAEAVGLDKPGISGWRFNDALYLRTRMTLLSPAWTNSAAGAGGLKVYVVPDVPVFLASDDGRLVSVRVIDQES